MSTDLIRFIDSISRDKNIDRESVFADLETAMVSALRKAYDDTEDAIVQIDRESGAIKAAVEGSAVDMKTLGRIAAQTAKQVMMQKIREDERSAIFEEYSERVGMVVTGTVVRYEGGGLIVNLGRGEGYLPRSEQIPGEGHQPGERIRGMILDVREEQSQVRIVLTQTHPDYIRKLFELEVPEVGERVIEIRALAREAGYRTKIAVSSIDTKVDAVGACVGVRGSRIRNIVDELGGEKIDIVRWNESSQVLITNALKPAEVKEVFLCFEMGRATVIVDEDHLSLAIGKRGQNVRLAARLTGWDIDILTPIEHNKAVDDVEAALKSVEGVEDVLLDKLLAMGIVSLGDLVEVGAEPLVKELELDEALAAKTVEVAAVEARRIAAETEAAKRAAAEVALEDTKEEAVQGPDAVFDTDGGQTDVDGMGVGDNAPEGPEEAIHAATDKDPCTDPGEVNEQESTASTGVDNDGHALSEEVHEEEQIASPVTAGEGEQRPVTTGQSADAPETQAGAVESGEPT